MADNPLDPNQTQKGLFDTVPPAATAPATPAVSTATATPATATGFQAAPYTPDPEKGTVQGQLKNVLSERSPLQQIDARDANEGMNNRGLLNSSLALGAVQEARYKNALPIAQADAGVYDKAMTNTANVENAARQFNAGAENAASQTNAQLGTSVSATNAQEANKIELAGLDAQTRVALGNLDVAARVKLAAIDTNSRLLIQTNASASEMYSQSVRNIADISRDPNLRPAAKQAAIDSQLNMLNQGLRQLQEVATTGPANVENLDISQFFNRYAQVAQMTQAQIDAETSRLQAAVNAAPKNSVTYRQAVEALNDFTSLARQAQAVNAPADTQSLNLAEGF